MHNPASLEHNNQMSFRIKNNLTYNQNVRNNQIHAV